MKTPSSSSRISRPWVKFVVEEHLKQQRTQPIPKVEIKDFNVSRGAKEGDAFNSELVTLDINASLRDDSPEAEPAEAEYHFIVKFLSTDPFNREMNSKFRSSLKEYIIYKEYINDLNAFSSSHASNGCHINIPHLIYGKHNDKEFALVMENLKYEGYENNDKYKGLDSEHLREAVIQLARFHALSYVYDKTQHTLTKYPFFKLNYEVLKVFEFFFNIVISNSIDLVRCSREDIAQKMEIFRERMCSEFEVFTQPNPVVPNCIIHGDYWNNNLMYKYKETKEDGKEHKSIVDCKIIDWGNSGWGSPVLDLQYLIKTSTTIETRKEHLEAILQCYHTTYTEITTELGMSVPNWTYDDLLNEWQRLELYGLLVGLTLSQGTLSKNNPANKLPEPSILDKSSCLPARFIVEGMKQGIAKMAIALMLTSSGQKLMTLFSKKMLGPIRDELLSGSNEIMNKRVLGVIHEAYDNGVFDKK